MPDLWRGIICLSLAVGFQEDRARLDLSSAVGRLRDVLAYNRLKLDNDERLFARVLEGTVTEVELAQAICSSERIGLLDSLTLQQ